MTSLNIGSGTTFGDGRFGGEREGLHEVRTPARSASSPKTDFTLTELPTMSTPTLPSNPLHNLEEFQVELWRRMLLQFKKYGTGIEINDDLLANFPLFHGMAPLHHPYPQAFTIRIKTTKYLWVEKHNGLVLLRRKLPSGRKISIDTNDFAMLNGGTGIAMEQFVRSGSNEVGHGIKYVSEEEARKLLLEFEE